MYRVPLFDLNYDGQEEQAVLETLRSKWISTGPRTAAFEAEFAAMLGAGHALALANCTAALHLAMRILDIGPGDEVICPSLTFVATVNAIRYVGAVPVFADIVDESNPNIDPDDIRRMVNERTKAVIVMHYAGFPCDMGAVKEIAGEHGLKIVEDACHGPLSEYGGKKLGTLGDVGCFSFFSNKNLSTAEGGMLVTDDAALHERAKLLRSHGMTTLSFERSKGHSTSYDVLEPGYNYRMDDLRASLGLVQLKKLREDLEKRSVVREWYEKALADIDQVLVPFRGHGEFASNYIFPVVLTEVRRKHRDDVRNSLHEAGVQTSMHYPPVHLFSFYREYSRELPVTERVAGKLITLPMYSSLGKSEVEFVATALGNAFG